MIDPLTFAPRTPEERGAYASTGINSALGNSAAARSAVSNQGQNVIGTSGQYFTNNFSGIPSWTGSSSYNAIKPPSMKVQSDAEFEGKVKIKGQDLGEFMETISKRLAILVPDPEKLEHFEALKKAYDHYKLVEALCELPKTETKE